MRNPMTSKTAPSEVHTRRIRKMCTQCIHPALTRDSSSPTPTRAARICADAHTAAKNALSEWVHTQKIREKCTHCIHPALTRDSPGPPPTSEATLRNAIGDSRSEYANALKTCKNRECPEGRTGSFPAYRAGSYSPGRRPGKQSSRRRRPWSSRLTAATPPSRLHAKPVSRTPPPNPPTHASAMSDSYVLGDDVIPNFRPSSPPPVRVSKK